MIYYLHIQEETTHFKTLSLAKARMLASIFPCIVSQMKSISPEADNKEGRGDVN